jgi:hypothetical protein
MSGNFGWALQQLLSEEGAKAKHPQVRYVLSQIGQCRTAAMGYHLLGCKSENDGAGCGHSRMQYHRCGNRHCPNCGGMQGEEWVESRKHELLPTNYFHAVFTVPEALNSLILGNRRAMYQLLMDASAETLLTLGRDPKWIGGTIGLTSILHTWGQTLSFHPHVHCIVSGGGIDQDHNWIKHKRTKGNFLFPAGAVRKVFKGLMMRGIRKLHEQGQLQSKGLDLAAILRTIGSQQWNTYAKPPFKDAQGVVDYLGRYTHKIAITRHRIKEITPKEVRFSYLDYKDGNKAKEMTLSRVEFARRFALHILPRRLVKIRHYGYLSNHHRTTRLAKIREKMKIPQPGPKVKVPNSIRMVEKYGRDLFQCPECKTGRMEILQRYHPPSPNPDMKGRLEALEAAESSSKAAPS